MSTPCRHCGTPLEQSFCDLGMSPLANSYLTADRLDRREVFYPLHAYVCSKCLLVQLAEFESAEFIFTDYLYFSSYSQSWLDHARAYVEDTTARFHLDSSKQVVEIASNDGYLLQYFVESGIPSLGIEPAENVAEVAVRRGIDTRVGFFGTSMASKLVGEDIRADLLIGNNVLAHVPDLNDFVAGMATVLAVDGVITMEFPHLLQLIEHNQFDTIYHEHFSYFSLLTVTRVFAAHGLRLFDVEQLSTHGGSLRIYACHAEYPRHLTSRRLRELGEKEQAAGLHLPEGYATFPERVMRTKRALLEFLIDARNRGKSTAAYGAPAKGNTLLNYCGIRDDLLDYTVDRSPHKQGKFLPGTHLPIYAPDHIRDTRPDYLLILPWNLRDEVVRDMSYIREWGGKFVVPVPELAVLD
ncbi:class I SAM-dependent methyltransferase [Rhodococcus jostii]|uniref:Methyltransferase domain-containing protein n=1 Tax=Rhodococcus jostii TaxID=132919 RepID=A0A1H5GZQ7_RHOJO|nr:class I SAM-dependent methyltransferase [Rhodococcus jostii]SEE21115.1 Methyltransferase domain-containing protein [Rhodococcus jostii]